MQSRLINDIPNEMAVMVCNHAAGGSPNTLKALTLVSTLFNNEYQSELQRRIAKKKLLKTGCEAVRNNVIEPAHLGVRLININNEKPVLRRVISRSFFSDLNTTRNIGQMPPMEIHAADPVPANLIVRYQPGY